MKTVQNTQFTWTSNAGTMYGRMCFLCYVLAWKTGQLNPTNIEEQKGRLKMLAEKGMSSSKMQHNLLCQNKRLQKCLFSCSINLIISHLLLTTFLMTNATPPRHATSSFLSGMVVKTEKSKIPYLEESNWTGIHLPWNRMVQKKNLLQGICKLKVCINNLKYSVFSVMWLVLNRICSFSASFCSISLVIWLSQEQLIVSCNTIFYWHPLDNVFRITYL